MGSFESTTSRKDLCLWINRIRYESIAQGHRQGNQAIRIKTRTTLLRTLVSLSGTLASLILPFRFSHCEKSHNYNIRIGPISELPRSRHISCN